MNHRLNLKDLKRLRQIVAVLVEEGFAVLVEELRLGWLTPLRCRMRCWFRRKRMCYPIAMGQSAVASEFPVRFRRTLERLGPTFVKFGQMLSLRSDILSGTYADELKKLQDKVAPIDGAVVKKQIEAEFGKPLARIFKKFNLKPVGSASLAQVHEAVLPNGDRKAVKVLRPGVREIVERDIHLLFFLARLMEEHAAALRQFRPYDLVKEFAAWTMVELDLTREAQHIDRFCEIHRNDPSVAIPKVDWERTTPRVLTMSFIEGVRADDRAGLRRQRLDVCAIARNAVRIAIVQFFEAGFFHADPHPGNFVIRRDGSLGLYDFGIVGQLDEAMRRRLLRALAAFVAHETDKYLDEILALSNISPGADIATFRREAREAVEQLYVPSDHRRRFASVIQTVVERAARYGIQFPVDFVLLGKALMTMEASALILDPKLDIEKEMAPPIQALVAQELSPGRIVKRAQTIATDWATLLAELPERTRHLFEKFERGEIGVKLDLQELQDFKRELDRQNDLRVLAVIAIAILAISAVLLRLDASMAIVGFGIGKIGLVIGGILLLWVIRLLIKQ